MNHVDRNGACVSGANEDDIDWGLRPVNWQVSVTNGSYEVMVDCAEDSSGWENCLADA
jgi:hypothetical protein